MNRRNFVKYLVTLMASAFGLLRTRKTTGEPLKKEPVFTVTDYKTGEILEQYDTVAEFMKVRGYKKFL